MTLAELVIKLSADSAVLRADFDKARKHAESFTSSLTSAFSRLGGVIAGVFSAGALAAMVKQAAQFGEEISLAAQRTGMATEQISALRFAAGQSNIEFSNLQNSLARLSKNIAGFGKDSDAAHRALKALGVSARDSSGQFVPLHGLLLNIADKFSQASDGGSKAAIAMALFGKSGAELIPLLNAGAAGIARLEARAKDLGVVLDAQAASGAELFNDELQALQTSLQGLQLLIADKLFGRLTVLVELFLRNKHAIAAFTANLELLSIGLGVVVAQELNFFGMNDKALEAMAAKAEQVMKKRTQALLDLQNELADLAQVGKETTAALTIPDAPRKEKKDRDSAKTTQELLQAQRELASIYRDLLPTVKGLDKVDRQYLDTLLKISNVGAQVNTTAVTRLNLSRLQTESLKTLRDIGLSVMEKFPVPKPEFPDFPGHPTGLPAAVFEKSKVDLDILKSKARELGREMQSAFTQMIIFGRSFGDALRSLLNLFVEFILQTVVFKSLAKSLSGKAGFLGVLGGFFGGLAGLQSGGPVRAGEPVIVGERGPEFFVPNLSGSVVPQGRGGLGGTVINIDARGADAGVEVRIMRALAAMHRQTVQDSVLAAQEAALRG